MMCCLGNCCDLYQVDDNCVALDLDPVHCNAKDTHILPFMPWLTVTYTHPIALLKIFLTIPRYLSRSHEQV